MTPWALGLAALLFQSSTVVNTGAPPRPENLAYQRRIVVPDERSGMTCAALDATILAHTASPAHSDLRVFGRLPGEPEAEVPYTLTESGPEPVADTAAAVDHLVATGNRLSFEVHMPSRPYSEVRLRLRLADFIGTATAEGLDHDSRPTPLGRVGLFDLSAQGLGRWTSLLLGEAAYPVLRITLTLRTPAGAPLSQVSAADLLGVEVPPSRARQTRYVPVASTDVVEREGPLSVALLRVPAHVPVERVAFRFDPGFTGNFAREVTVSARAVGAPVTDTEALDAGAIVHIDLPSGDPQLRPIVLREDALDATLGATLAGAAYVLVAVNNDGHPPLPIRAVTLEMRERKLCFFADRLATYTLRYGDPTLAGPTYDEGALTVPADPLSAQLGPEQRNPAFRARLDSRPLLKRHPEVFWLLVLLCGGMMGGSALHHVQHRRI